MRDRLRDLLDLVLTAPAGVDGAELARRASFSRDHLDRLLNAATGEPPGALRRRLLLERAAWQLRQGATVAEAAAAAGYGSSAAFSRAFTRAHGTSPSRLDGRGHRIDAPNGIHFHPPGGLTVPQPRMPGGGDLQDRLVAHHVKRTRELLRAAAALPADALDRRMRPGLVVLGFEGPEETAALMAERLVVALEVWNAAIAGEAMPELLGDRLDRFERAAPRFARLASRIRETGAYGDAFVDALCEPPEMFVHGDVLAHVLTFGAIRREHLASVLTELGATLGDPDPLAPAGGA